MAKQLDADEAMQDEQPISNARWFVSRVQANCLMKGIPTRQDTVHASGGIGLFLVINGRLGILTLDVSTSRNRLKVLVPGFMVGNQKIFEAQVVFLDDEKLKDTSTWVDILTHVFLERFQRLSN